MPRFDPVNLNSDIQLASQRKRKDYLKRMGPKVRLPELTQQTFKLGCVRRMYSKNFYATVIALRFGSLVRVNRPVRTLPLVSRIVRVPLVTVQSMCTRHRLRPGCLWNPQPRSGRPRRIFTQEHLEAMISPTSLEEHKFLSLRERVKLLWDEHGLSISKTALQNVY